MPRKKSRRDVEEEDEDLDAGDESGSSISTEVVQADFEAFTPSEKDFDGIKSLLQQLLLKTPIDYNELTGMIVNQKDLGCVHKVAIDEDSDEDAMDSSNDDVYGVVTAIDVSSNEKECIRQLKAMLRKRFDDSSSKAAISEPIKDTFNQLWNPEKSTRIGWIINERLVNIPFQIAVPSFESLLEELDASNKKFDQFVAILKIHKIQSSGESSGASSGGGHSGKKGRASKSKKTDQASSDPIVYANAEEELLNEECDCFLDYCVSNETDGGILGDRKTEDGSYKPYRRIVMFDREILDKFVAKLKLLG